jgi:hypothetical protein
MMRSARNRSAAHFAYWDDIAVLFKDTKTVSTGHGFCGIGRKQLLLLLQARAKELGVELRFETKWPVRRSIPRISIWLSLPTV